VQCDATLLQLLKLFPRLESHGFAGRNSHFGAGARITADPRLSRTHVEDAEAAQFNPFAVSQRALHAFENSLDGHLRFGLGDAGSVDDFIDDVELNQCLPPKVSDTALEAESGGTTNS